MTSRRSSGSMRADNAVEPTRSEKHHRHLAALGRVLRLWLDAGGGLRRRVSCSGLRSDSGKYLPSWAKRNANVFQILIGKVGEYGNVNLVLGKALSVLPKAEVLKPVRNLLHRGPSAGYQRRLEHNADAAGRPDTSRSGVCTGRTGSCDKLNPHAA